MKKKNNFLVEFSWRHKTFQLNKKYIFFHFFHIISCVLICINYLFSTKKYYFCYIMNTEFNISIKRREIMLWIAAYFSGFMIHCMKFLAFFFKISNYTLQSSTHIVKKCLHWGKICYTWAFICLMKGFFGEILLVERYVIFNCS